MAKLTAAQMTPELPLAMRRDRSRYSRRDQRIIKMALEYFCMMSIEVPTIAERVAAHDLLKLKVEPALHRRHVR